MINYAGYVVVYTWIVCAGTCAVIAASKERNPTGWFLLSLLFGYFALVAVCALPSFKTSIGKATDKVPSNLDDRDYSFTPVEPKPIWRTKRPEMASGKYGKSWNSVVDE